MVHIWIWKRSNKWNMVSWHWIMNQCGIETKQRTNKTEQENIIKTIYLRQNHVSVWSESQINHIEQFYSNNKFSCHFITSILYMSISFYYNIILKLIKESCVWFSNQHLHSHKHRNKLLSFRHTHLKKCNHLLLLLFKYID